MRTSRFLSRLASAALVVAVVVGAALLTGGVASAAPTTAGFPTSNASPMATTITVDVTPDSPVAAGIVKWLTAMVSPLEAAGSVQFKAGDNNIGRPVAVSGGTASTKTRLVVGTHPLTAVFTPTDPNAFSASTSNTVTYVVNAPTGAKATITPLVGPSVAFPGLPVVLVAIVMPSDAAGTVQFKDGTTAISAPVPVVGGTAILITRELMMGPHWLTAEFTPTNPAAFGPSTSPPMSLEVQPILQ